MNARLKKAGLWLLVVLLAVQALGYFFESTRTLIIPHTSYSGAGYTSSRLAEQAARGNGLNFLAGLSFLWLALRVGNGATRRPEGGPGGVDRLLGRISASDSRPARWFPLALSLVCFGAAAILFTSHLSVHTTADAAARAFDSDVDALSIQVNGHYVYGVSRDESVLHVAAFTPALLRSFRAADLPIGQTIPDVEFPVPGLLPLLILAGAILLWTLRPKWRPRLLVLVSLASGYVLLWLASADSMVTIFDAYTVNPEWFVNALVIAGTLLSLLAVVSRNKDWFGLYCLGVLLALAWSYRYSGATPLALTLFWLLPFAALLCLFWWRTVSTPAVAAK